MGNTVKRQDTQDMGNKDTIDHKPIVRGNPSDLGRDSSRC
jgi:hypothetical protein